MEKSRSHYALKNSAISFATQLLTMLMKFSLQTFFIKQLGAYYLGINGLFSNILSILSIAELGVGTAIIFNLYKPMADQDHETVAAYVNFYKKAYFTIGSLVFILGLLILPFINGFIKGQTVSHVHLIFFLFLLNSVIGYFFAHKATLFTASQREYKNQVNLFLFYMIQTFLQMGILLMGLGYIYFLVIQIICTLVANITIARKVNQEYGFLKKYKEKRISKGEYKQIKRNVMELMGSKFGGVLIQGTDNLLVSSFIGLRAVGLFSNYQLITNSVVLLQSRVINGTIASIGNLAAEDNSEKAVSIYKKHFFINFMMTVFCGSMMLNLFQPFIHLWLGSEFNLSFYIVVIIVLNYYFQQLRQTANSFLVAYGTLQYQGVKSFIEAGINLSISYVLVRYTQLGIAGALLGTIVTNLVLNSWFENFQVFRLGFRQSVKGFLWHQYRYWVMGLLMMTVNYMVVTRLVVCGGMVGLMLNVVLTTGMIGVLGFVCFGRVPEFKAVMSLGCRVMGKVV